MIKKKKTNPQHRTLYSIRYTKLASGKWNVTFLHTTLQLHIMQSASFHFSGLGPPQNCASYPTAPPLHSQFYSGHMEEKRKRRNDLLPPLLVHNEDFLNKPFIPHCSPTCSPRFGPEYGAQAHGSSAGFTMDFGLEIFSGCPALALSWHSMTIFYPQV